MDVFWTKRSEGLLRTAPSTARHSFALLVLCHGGADLVRELSALLADGAAGVAVIGTSADLPDLMAMAAGDTAPGEA